jgi:hypothetical protein
VEDDEIVQVQKSPRASPLMINEDVRSSSFFGLPVSDEALEVLLIKD